MNYFFKKLGQEQGEEKDFVQVLCDMACRQMEKTYFLLPAFLDEGEKKENAVPALQKIITEEIPLYGYLAMQDDGEETEDKILSELIKKQEGTDEDTKNIEESRLDYSEDALHIENSMLEEMQRENSEYMEGMNEEQTGAEQEKEAEITGESMSLELSDFQPVQYPAYSYDWSEEWSYDDLVSNFYAIDNTTSLKEEYIDLENLLDTDLSVDKNSDGPQILIYHTHSQEAFADSVPGDPSTTIVGAGEKLAKLLSEEYGFQVLHHTGEYDVENRDYAYNNSLPALKQILEENPTIEVVIDLHRDEMKEGKKLVIDLQGRPTARFMFFNGMSYIKNKGEISYLENPYIQENLAFSFQTQVAANEYYPGIARKIYLKAYRYNMHLKPKSMLIELGAQTNTVEEIMNACDPLAHIISIVLGG
ncbi:MAG: stage II sporulation protein P [Suilimivivens sp.]